MKVVRIDKSLPLPEYKTEGAVAFDLYSREDISIPAGKIEFVPSNLILEVPAGHALLVASRSSTFKKGLRMANGIGIIDQDFHGPEDELQLVFQNFTEETVKISKGERMAQGILVPILKPQLQEVEAIKKDSRGKFGSTGDF